MTDLDKAAAEASKTLGLSVEHPRFGVVEVYDSLDSPAGSMPIESFTGMPCDTLAYMQGLEAGARIANVRHAPLVKAARSRLDTITVFADGLVVKAGDDYLAPLTEALAELEG